MKKYNTLFQRKFPGDMESAIGIIAITHPHLDSELVKAALLKRINNPQSKSLRVYAGPYDWVSIEGTVAFPGKIYPERTSEYVSVCIDNSRCMELWGKITWDEMVKATIKFHVWTTALDHSHYRYEESTKGERILTTPSHINDEANHLAAQYLIGRGYHVQSHEEFWANYWSD